MLVGGTNTATDNMACDAGLIPELTLEIHIRWENKTCCTTGNIYIYIYIYHSTPISVDDARSTVITVPRNHSDVGARWALYQNERTATDSWAYAYAPDLHYLNRRVMCRRATAQNLRSNRRRVTAQR